MVWYNDTTPTVEQLFVFRVHQHMIFSKLLPIVMLFFKTKLENGMVCFKLKKRRGGKF